MSAASDSSNSDVETEQPTFIVNKAPNDYHSHAQPSPDRAPRTSPVAASPSRYSFQSDIYMYGIFLWECFAQSEPYPELGHKEAARHVVLEGLRPNLPESWPLGYRELMTQCWHPDPEQRPKSMEQVTQRLKVLQATFTPLSVNEASTGAAKRCRMLGDRIAELETRVTELEQELQRVPEMQSRVTQLEGEKLVLEKEIQDLKTRLAQRESPDF
eukprot:gb/GEZN01010405.1/.p1 GENE.gb/GEZN01010405.1/~~gb/GEZN01010405.1/.p1  ORF type:complete len:214 (+),score=30.28 gb/GEZN01010405.1/:379-1020(+)